jgi:hypothetical protein
MNIFFLDSDPVACAQAHYDKHVVKMILEYAQLLSTAHRMTDGDEWTDKTKSGSKIKRWSLPDSREQILYKATHRNHPSAVWVRESRSNYLWLVDLFENLLSEYTHRYGKQHKTGELLETLKNPPENLEDVGYTRVAQAMPDECKRSKAVDAYRNYYLTNKRELFSYTNRITPRWAL